MTKEQILFLKSIANKIDDVSEVDLNKVFELAERHHVLPLVFENLSDAKGFDEGEFNKYSKTVFSLVMSQTRRTVRFKEVYAKVVNKGLTPLVFKGIIVRNLYRDLCDHRPSGDEDILIKEEDYFRLAEVLEENGYVPNEKVTKKTLGNIQEVTFSSPNGLNIEVHLNIIGTENKLRNKMNKYFKNAFENCITMEIDGQEYYTLDYSDNYIYLFYHLFKHFTTAGVGVRQLLDLLKFAEDYGSYFDWHRIYEAIESINAQKMYGDLVEIGNKYMGFSIDNPYGITQPEKLIDDMFSAGAFGNGNLEQMGSKVKVMAAIDSDGKSSKLKMIFPSSSSMREHYTVLNDHPYLLPVMWVVRIVRYIFRSKTGKTYDVSKSEQIADKKIQLLKDYNII